MLKERVVNSFIFMTIATCVYLRHSRDTCIDVSLMQNVNKYKHMECVYKHRKYVLLYVNAPM